MPCTNILRKVMMQLPLTIKGANNIEDIKALNFQQIFTDNVLQMPDVRSVAVD